MNKTKSVNLLEIINALEDVDDANEFFLNTVTGEIISYCVFGDNDVSAEELEDECYIKLPDSYEINEYHMMETFAYDRDSDGTLIGSIRGDGAFRKFRETVDKLNLQNDWEEFKMNCYRERAVTWCDYHKIAYHEGSD